MNIWDETLTLLKYSAGASGVLLIVLAQLHDKESVPGVLDNTAMHSQEEFDANP